MEAPFSVMEAQILMFDQDKTVADSSRLDRTSMDCIDSILENIVVDLMDLTMNSMDSIQMHFLPLKLEYVEHDTNLVHDRLDN